MSSFIAFLTSLIEWQNIAFTTTIALGAVMFGIQALGLIGSDSESNGDAAIDGDHDAAVEGDHEALADAEHDADFDPDTDLGLEEGANQSALSPASEGHGSKGLALTKWLGFGTIPLTLLLPFALTGFGFSGLFASLAFGGFGESGRTIWAGAFTAVMVLASVGSILSVQVAARLFRRIVPDVLKTASDRFDLLGLIGIVKTARVDADFGQVQVRDAFGRELEVACVALDAERTSQYGEEVVLVDWDVTLNRFKVVPLNETLRDETRRVEDGRRRARSLRLAARKPKAQVS